jgi:hypothetical protein
VEDRSLPAGSDGAAVLDIGDDVGALVLYAPEALLGTEVELAPDDDPSRRIHTVVRTRQIGSRRVFPAVFPSLGAGRYRICVPGAPVDDTVTIAGGIVAEAGWPR